MKNFLITVDTEGDNQWVRQEKTTTVNAEFLPRFQSLCEKYNLKPTYLTNWEMANSQAYIEFGKDVLARKVGEIGMHLHPWDMPPDYQLTYDDLETKPYLIEYPDWIMREKIKVMTDHLENTFGCKMKSHRAGRWSFDSRYASMLIEQGYLVDCSVTPNFSWTDCLGDPKQKGGTDYMLFPERAYFLSSTDIGKSGDSGLLEVPMTIIQPQKGIVVSMLRQLCRKSKRLRFRYNRMYPPLWLRPTGREPDKLVKIIDFVVERQRDYAELMLHSSELMPGGSPALPDKVAVDRLYQELEAVFQYIQGSFTGKTLCEYYQEVVS